MTKVLSQDQFIQFINLSNEFKKVDMDKSLNILTKEEASKQKKRLRDKWYRLEKKFGTKISKETILPIIPIKETTVDKLKKSSSKEVLNHLFGIEEQEELSLPQVLCKLSDKLINKFEQAKDFYHIDINKTIKVEKTMTNLKNLVGKKNFILIDITQGNQRFEVNDSNLTKGFRNCSCGSWNRIMKDANVYVFTW